MVSAVAGEAQARPKKTKLYIWKAGIPADAAVTEQAMPFALACVGIGAAKAGWDHRKH